ncbi:MAG: energy-coupling factor transporter transmembrane protein EcfT, partial [Chloroflexi bacterium]|nr:energy-coupling factor transporter transmembrane protein EcfT [Chloroflexota bacterium]
MDEFDFARGVTVGQYVPGNSILHRLDPRAKLGGFVIVLAAVIT